MRKFLLAFAIGSMFITACAGSNPEDAKTHSAAVGNPAAEQILREDRNVDIFMFGGIVYQNAEQVDWVRELQLTPGQQVGEIKKRYRDGDKFENEMSTRLPEGTKIYAPKEKNGALLLVETNGQPIKYLGLIEG